MVPNLSRDYSFETRGPSSIDDDFWQSVDQRGARVIRIAPRCEQELGMLGFELSPLQCQRLIGEVILSTTLTEFLRPDLRDGPLKRAPRGFTELKITLIQHGDGYGDSVPVGATVVRFSVTDERENKPVHAGDHAVLCLPRSTNHRLTRVDTHAGGQGNRMHQRNTMASHPPDTIHRNVFTQATASCGLPALNVVRRLSRQVQPPS